MDRFQNTVPRSSIASHRIAIVPIVFSPRFTKGSDTSRGSCGLFCNRFRSVDQCLSQPRPQEVVFELPEKYMLQKCDVLIEL